VAQVVLNGARILSVIGELVARGVAQHVAMDKERKAGSLPSSGNHALITSHTEWRARNGERKGLGRNAVGEISILCFRLD
jgi:hypothetical protein